MRITIVCTMAAILAKHRQYVEEEFDDSRETSRLAVAGLMRACLIRLTTNIQ
jgi:hypothetical protein